MKKKTGIFITLIFVISIMSSVAQETNASEDLSGSWIYKGNTSVIQGDRVVDIFEDQLNNIWVLSSDKNGENEVWGKINLFDGTHWNYFKDQPEIFDHYFQRDTTFPSYYYHGAPGTEKLYFDRKDGMKCMFDGHSWTFTSRESVKMEYNLPDNEKIIDIVFDKYGRLWVTTKKGLLLCESGNFRRFMPDLDFSDKSAISRYSYNMLTPELYLVSTKGIYHFEDDQFRFCKSFPGWVLHNFAYIDSVNACFWVFQTANKPYIFLRYFNGRWSQYIFERKYGLPRIQAGPDYSLWFLWKRRIAYLDKNDHLTYLPVDEKKLQPKTIYASHMFDKIVFNSLGEAWISCVIDKDAGAYRWEKAGGFFISWDGSAIRYYNQEDDLPRLRVMYIRDILSDMHINFWVVTGFPMQDIFATDKTAAIIRKNENSWDIFDVTKGFTARFYTKIFEDSKGQIWIGSSNNGLFLYRYNQ
jgi:hypothetical protein